MEPPVDAPAVDRLTQVVYELLDAHDDTVRLAGEFVDDPSWAAHLDYIRALQRVGREALAAAGPAVVMTPGAPGCAGGADGAAIPPSAT